ncbi:MAG: sugar phosphate nucleotidyltransferase [Candidatus Bathyarchaeota archaeon]|jgi:phosphoenolpyruvate phosphomutase
MILNSGLGTRLYPMTKTKPKALLEIGNKTLLGHQLDSLTDCRISNVIMTTGPFEEKIKHYIETGYPNLNVTYVKNPKYLTTNYIYSMWLTKSLIADDIVLFHGDLFFDALLLKRLVDSKVLNCVLVNRKMEPPAKDFKAVIENSRVTQIGVEFFGAKAFFCAPLYKFSKADFMSWLNQIGQFVERDDLSVYAENAFNEISNQILLQPLYYDEEICLEIDTKEDLELARSLI